MTPADRAWYRVLPLFAIPVAALAIFAVVQLYVLDGDLPGWGLQAGITFLYFFPGLLLSIGTSQLLVWRRVKPRVVTTGERILIGLLVGLTVILSLTSIDRNAFIGLLLGPIIIILAIALTFTIAVVTSRLKRNPVAPAMTVEPPASSSPYGPVGP